MRRIPIAVSAAVAQLELEGRIELAYVLLHAAEAGAADDPVSVPTGPASTAISAALGRPLTPTEAEHCLAQLCVEGLLRVAGRGDATGPALRYRLA